MKFVDDAPPTQPQGMLEAPTLQNVKHEAALYLLSFGEEAMRELYAHFGAKCVDNLPETDWDEFIRLAQMTREEGAKELGQETAPPPIAVKLDGNTTITMRDKAVALAKMGLRVLPVKPGTKEPAQPPNKRWPPKGQYHQYIPSSDPADVAAMWTGPQGQSLNFDAGINCEGKLVIDVDDRNGRTGTESFAKLAEQHGLDLNTVVASTPSGGRHYFYKLPPGIESTTVKSGSDKLGSGVDHRSYNALVVGAGTVRPGKGEYKWVRSPDETEMKIAPMSLVELCRRAHIREPHDPIVVPGLELDTSDAVERFRQYAAECALEAVEGGGGRNATMAILRRAGDYGLSYLVATEVLCEEGGWNDTKAHPPWDEGELLEFAESLEPSRERPIGCDHPFAHFDRVEIEEKDEGSDGEKGAYGNKSAYGDKGGSGKNRTADGEAPRDNKALAFWSFDSEEAPAPKGWIIKDVAAKGETAGWIGPPGCGKSAIVLDWLVHSATGRDWRGHKCRQQTASVYFAFERANLTRRRIKAYAQRWKLNTVPIAVVSRMLDLLHPETVPIILDTITAVENFYGMPVASIAFDTLPKGIAAGGGDENSARDVNRAAANLRRIHDERSLHIAAIGHTGKDQTRGARGSNANQGDWDVEFQIHKKANGIKLVRVEKANDQDEGALTAFHIQQVKIGLGDDLEDILTSIVSEDIPAVAADVETNQQKLSDREALALRALSDCLETHGRAPPSDIDGAEGLVCELKVWRDALLSRGVVERSDNGNHRKVFQRLHQALARKGCIGLQNDFVWISG